MPPTTEPHFEDCILQELGLFLTRVYWHRHFLKHIGGSNVCLLAWLRENRGKGFVFFDVLVGCVHLQARSSTAPFSQLSFSRADAFAEAVQTHNLTTSNMTHSPLHLGSIVS